MYSLFEEQITTESFYLDYYLSHGTDSYAESLNYFPEMQTYNVGPDEYLELIRRAKEAVGIPIIGSLNGTSTGGWIDYARSIEEAGANALELNVYYIPTSTYLMGAEVEYIYTDILHDVKNAIEIPVAMKLSPYFSSTANIAQRLADGGADGLVLFNRFYQPDLDIEKLEVLSRLVLSSSDELRLPLSWVGLLYGRVDVDFAMITKHYGSGGRADASAAVRYSPTKIISTTTEVVTGDPDTRHILVFFPAFRQSALGRDQFRLLSQRLRHAKDHSATQADLEVPAGGVLLPRSSAFRPVAAGHEPPACGHFRPHRCQCHNPA